MSWSSDLLAAAAVRTDELPGWHLHADVWMIIAVAAFAWTMAVRLEPRRREGLAMEGQTVEEPVVTRRQIGCFVAGLAVVFVASDWPVHDLAEGYLYSVHMVQHMLITLVAAPLLLLGTPAWLLRRLLPGRLLRVVRQLARPVPNLVQFNAILVLSHWPFWVNGTLRNHPLHFVAHALLLLSALLMWMVIVSPLPEVPRARRPMQMLYLFLQTLLPTVPASFLTFGSKPLYSFYETVPRLYGWSALSDQQVAGLIMKLVGGFYLYAIIAVIFFRWYGEEERKAEGEEQQLRLPETLYWDDVERELKQLG
jgi:putative membrane protein